MQADRPVALPAHCIELRCTLSCGAAGSSCPAGICVGLCSRVTKCVPLVPAPSLGCLVFFWHPAAVRPSATHGPVLADAACVMLMVLHCFLMPAGNGALLQVPLKPSLKPRSLCGQSMWQHPKQRMTAVTWMWTSSHPQQQQQQRQHRCRRRHRSQSHLQQSSASTGRAVGCLLVQLMARRRLSR